MLLNGLIEGYVAVGVGYHGKVTLDVEEDAARR